MPRRPTKHPSSVRIGGIIFIDKTMCVGTRGKPTSRSVGQVLRSLTTNAKGIFTLLAQHQIAQEELAKSTNENSGGSSAAAAANEETSTLGLTFETLYQMCREEFFVSNDQTLRTHLVEFKDHDVRFVFFFFFFFFFLN